MRYRLTISILSIVAIAAAAGTGACSSSATAVPDSPAADGGNDATSAAPDADASTVDAAQPVDAKPDLACGKEPTQAACATCCGTNHPPGYQTFVKALIGCACQGAGSDAATGAGPCADACKTTLCGSPPRTPSADCTTCVQKVIGAGGSCGPYVSDLCTVDPDCVGQQQCVAQCQNKP